MENKNSYFLLKIKLPFELQNSRGFNEKLNNAVDQILYSMGAENTRNNHVLKKDDNSLQLYIFRTNNRKRKGQLNKFCERYLDPEWNLTYETKGLSISEVPSLIQQAKEKKNYRLDGDYSYEGRDIKVFDNKENWYQWQTEIYKMIFHSDGRPRVRDDREIISLIDFRGNSGKSSFWKYLYVNYKKEIGRLTYGSASQLRSQIVKIGSKPIYIIDLTRTKGEFDRQEDLLSLIEDAKSGFVISPMYGANAELIMDPPTIILSANYKFEEGSLSEDRWSIYEIKDNKLGKKNALLKKTSKLKK